MKKVRLNTSLRHKLEYYVRSQLDAAQDKTPLDDARRCLEAEALRLVVAAYPQEDMATLAKYGRTSRYSRFTFILPDGAEEDFECSQALPYDLPACGGYRFEPSIPADAAFAAAAQQLASVEAALRAERHRQWKQAEVLIGCAVHFEDVLDYLGVVDSERVSLTRRWSLPDHQVEQEQEALAA
jgi:hypothetical protein